MDSEVEFSGEEPLDNIGVSVVQIISENAITRKRLDSEQFLFGYQHIIFTENLSVCIKGKISRRYMVVLND